MSARVISEVRPLCIVGPTAVGKSAVAMAVAERIEGVELVSVDSMQVYRGMDIGTAKPTAAERAAVHHHLIDIADPADEFTVASFRDAWRAVEADLAERGAIPVLVGGTGLYLRAVVDDLDIPGRFPEARAAVEERAHDLPALHRELAALDPLAASRIDPANERRLVRALEVTIGSGRPFSTYGPGLERYPDVPFRLLGLDLDRAALDRRIDERYDHQVTAGFVDEVRALASRPAGIGHTARQALGYRELLRHVEHGLPLDVALDEARTRTRRFARRQQKWFRRDPRVEWIQLEGDRADPAAAVDRAVALAGAA